MKEAPSSVECDTGTGTERSSECEGNAIAAKKEKKLRKMKIRLKNRDDPDSYVCEIFNSSAENEGEKDSERGDKETDEEITRDGSKPKDFFDVLMSKESRRNFTVDTALENEKIPEETKLLREVESKEVILNRRMTKLKNKGKLMEMASQKKGDKNLYSETSSDESIFQGQTKLKFVATKRKEVGKEEEEQENRKEENKGSNPGSENSESGFSWKKKSPNLLRYFSKTVTRKSKENEARARNGKVRVQKLVEIDMFESHSRESRNSWDSSDVVAVEDVRSMKRTASDGEDVKLAPLFRKRAKTVLDPRVKKARREFLANGLPTCVKKTVSVSNGEETIPVILFPKISHVRQLEQRDGDDDAEHDGDAEVRLREEAEDSDFTTEGFRYRISPHREDDVDNSGKKESRKNPLNALRIRYKHLKVQSLLAGLKEKRDEFAKKAKAAEKSTRWTWRGKDDDLAVLDDVASDADAYNPLWTEKYKLKSGEMIGNKRTIAKLTEWLKSWKEYDKEAKVLGKCGGGNGKAKTDDSDDSDDSDDFVSDADSCGLRSPCNTCFLSGPVSCGKTALVYALAAELEFNVLEVNASSKRTGKKLIELQEATKSHVVSGAFGQDGGKPPKGKRRRKKLTTSRGGCKISLILIEDADIFFEGHDEGFLPTIASLVQSSKRPFIFLSNDPQVRGLERLRAQSALVLEMHRPSFRHSCALLDAIASLEGVALDRASLEHLIRDNCNDLRKSILELQFWISSGKALPRVPRGDLGRLWWDLIGKAKIHDAKRSYPKRRPTSDLYDSSSGGELPEEGEGKLGEEEEERAGADAAPVPLRSQIFDCFSVSDLLDPGHSLEPVPAVACRQPKDGLSLCERMEDVDWKLRDLSAKISSEVMTIATRIFAGNVDATSGPPWEEIRWRSLQDEARRDLSAVVPHNGAWSKRTLHLDYLPAMRNMCRAERDRFVGNTKRKNRFSHYFRTLGGAQPRERSVDVSCDVFAGDRFESAPRNAPEPG